MDFLKQINDIWGVDSILFQNTEYIVIKIYQLEQRDKEIDDTESIETTKKVLVQRAVNPKYLIIDMNEETNQIKKFINIKNLTINSNFLKFLNLQEIDNEYLSICNIDIDTGYVYRKINRSYYDNYLKHLSFRDNIKNKTNNIIKSKFSKNIDEKKKPNTSAILSNIGYIISKKEGDYLELSKNDYSFIKNFVNKLIIDEKYELKVTESLPLFKEDIKKIILIGKELLKLTSNKTKIRSMTKKHFEETRNTIEGAWQLFFSKYLKLFFMKYKLFYSNFIFKALPGYEKDTIPDFLAVDLYNNIDIIEIKKHDTPLFRKEKGRDSYYPSSDLTKSIFQLNKYLDLTSDLIKIDKIDDTYVKSLISNNKLYRPRGILIISSQKHMGASKVTEQETIRMEKEVKKLKTAYSNIEIVLFDELIESLERYLEQIEFSLSKNKK